MTVDGRQSSLPLEDLKVLDLGTFIAAPFAATMLADFGADVLKVEMPGSGDSLRTLGESSGGAPLLWLQESRNKRTITCDLRMPEGQELIRDFVRSGYDVVVENFRPGTLERWNLSYSELRKVTNSVILGRISGYGQTGPARGRPGFGRVAQAFGGLTYLCGFPDRPPANPGSATIADYLAGLFLAFGVLVAAEERRQSGEGQELDMALYEGISRIMDSLAVTYSANGTVRERTGTGTPLAAPHNHYPTRDGRWVAIACTNDRMFERLAVAMGRPDLLEDSRFTAAPDRVMHRSEIDDIVTAWTSTLTIGPLVETLLDADVPSSPILSIADAFDDPQYQARPSFEWLHDDRVGELAVPAIVPRLSLTPGRISWLGRELGEDTTAALMNELGYSAERVNDLRQRGVL